MLKRLLLKHAGHSKILILSSCLLYMSCEKELIDGSTKSTNKAPQSMAATDSNPYDIEEVRGAGTGASVYVATTGNDNAAGTISAPLKTLTKAMQKVAPGGTIIMRAGKYQGAVINSGFGTADAWVTLKAATGEEVTLQGNPRGTDVATLYFYNSSCDEYAPAGSVCLSAYWRVMDLNILSTAQGGGDANVIKIDMPHVQIDHCKLSCAVPDIIKIVRTANNAAVLNCEIFSNPAIVEPSTNSQGVDITGADNVRVIGNYFHDLPDVALYAKGNARNPIFACNRINNTGFYHDIDLYAAIMLGQQTDESRLVDGPYESYDGLVVNNIISNCSGPALTASSSFNSHFIHNTCINVAQWGHAGMFISSEGGLDRQTNDGVYVQNNIFIMTPDNPLFVKNMDVDWWKPTPAPLVFEKNIYWVTDSIKPSFLWIPYYYSREDGPYTLEDWNGILNTYYGTTDTSLFDVNPSLNASDFIPQSGSAAIGAAVPNYAKYDFYGKERSATPTIGAVEP